MRIFYEAGQRTLKKCPHLRLAWRCLRERMRRCMREGNYVALADAATTADKLRRWQEGDPSIPTPKFRGVKRGTQFFPREGQVMIEAHLGDLDEVKNIFNFDDEHLAVHGEPGIPPLEVTF